MVVVDKFSKYAHFLPLSHPFTALQVVQLYLNHIDKLHGLPTAIISDRDKVFTSQVWQELFRLSDTKLLMSSSYHPQMDGQTERLNQCLETFLRCLVHSCPTKWLDWLPLAEYWYNTTFHSALGKDPLWSSIWSISSTLGYLWYFCMQISRLGAMVARKGIAVQTDSAATSAGTATDEASSKQESFWKTICSGGFGLPKAPALCAIISCTLQQPEAIISLLWSLQDLGLWHTNLAFRSKARYTWWSMFHSWSNTFRRWHRSALIWVLSLLMKQFLYFQ